MNLLHLADLSAQDVHTLWSLADSGPAPPLPGTVAWSFEGPGIRTRAAFLQAFRDLGLACTELPNLLQSSERVEDLAGYLDPFFSLYVIRAADHDRLSAFAAASQRPVVNAMSRRGHPCEVLTDAWFIERSVKPLQAATVCLWGPTTNVFRSWHELAGVLGFRLVQVCAARHHEPGGAVHFTTAPPPQADVVITDAWPAGTEDDATPLGAEHLRAMGDPLLLPTPPFQVGRELLVDPRGHPRFAGYAQKQGLLPMHRAILRFVARA